MFTASLVSALVWAVDDRQDSFREPFKDRGKLKDLFSQSMLSEHLIPVLIRSDNLGATEWLSSAEVIDSPGSRWIRGWFEASRLTKYLDARGDLPFHRELVDLGTPVESHSVAAADVPDCEFTLGQNPLSSTDVVVAIVDRGDPSNNPETFRGRLEYLQGPVQMTLSQHARDVLSILIDRLASNGILATTKLVASLVEEPQTPVGNHAFEHANTVEMTAALERVRNRFIGEDLPIIVNLSMGTHVGPHCGQSPLEELVKQVFHPADNRFLVAAAGNDGTRGIHARCVVQPQVDEYFTIKLGDGGIHSLLVEFWYREGPVPLTFNVELLPPKRPAMFPPVQLLAGQAQGNFMQVLVNGMGVAVGSLCWSDPYPQGLRCTTLALKINPRGSPVAPFAGNCCLHDCKVQVSVSGGPTTVNAWIAVQEPDESAWFLAGNRDGSVRVPATAETSLSVGAVLANRQPWAGTAVGPAFDYGANAFLGSPNVPVLSHLGGHQGRFGTSFAAPRVTADAAALITGDRTRRFPDVRALVDQLSKQPGAVWHPRLGYACLA